MRQWITVADAERCRPSAAEIPDTALPRIRRGMRGSGVQDSAGVRDELRVLLVDLVEQAHVEQVGRLERDARTGEAGDTAL